MRVGDQVRRIATAEIGVIIDLFASGLVNVSFPSGVRSIHESELEVVAADPFGAVRQGRFGHTTPYGLRIQSLYLHHAYKYDPLAGLSNARIEPAGHQVYTAHRVVAKLRPRMILADEVGLGKTIEAGLILKELRARKLVDRVLIIVPASLQMQWQQELLSKFNERFEIIDGPAARLLGRAGENPWKRRNSVISSLTLSAHPNNADLIVEAGWDMVIFDEAHKVRRKLESANRIRSTRAYDLADELKELTTGLLLLTATPMQLHPFELYSLVELTEPGLYPSFDDYEMRRRELPHLNQLMKQLLQWEALSGSARAAAAEAVGRLIQGALVNSAVDLDNEATRNQLIDELIKLHPLADTLVRNRKTEIGGFTRREPNTIPVELTPIEQSLYEDVSDYIRRGYNLAQTERRYAVGFLMVLYQQMLASSSSAIRRSFLRRIDKLSKKAEEIRAIRAGDSGEPDQDLDELRDAEELTVSVEELEQLAIDEADIEAEILELKALVERLGTVRDAKARELLKAVDTISKESPGEKILIFTQYIETQQFLKGTFETNAYEVATFNGSMRLEEKESEVQRFRGPAQILISTEAGGEGRNFQFAHFMFNYDLPWNPMKLEQRIGRLDRIGQKRPVFIYNLACKDTVEERILEVLDKRIGLFKESVGSLDPILGEVERDIERLVLRQASHFNEAFEEYAIDLEQRVRQARETERVMADFILDRASFRRDRVAELMDRKPMASSADLERHISSSLAYFGGRLDDHPEGGSVINLSPRLASMAQVREYSQRGVFDPKLALEREDLQFLAFGNPVVDSIVRLPIDQSPVLTGRRRLEGSRPGLCVEVIYEIESEGLDRFGVFLRHEVDAEGNVAEEELAGLPPLGMDDPSLEVPEWVEMAFERSREQAVLRLQRERERVLARHLERQRFELERADRVYQYRRIRLERIIREEAEWIQEKEAAGTEREKRILPARRGKLAANRDRLNNLAAEYQQTIDSIRNRTADVALRTVAAGLVTGS